MVVSSVNDNTFYFVLLVTPPLVSMPEMFSVPVLTTVVVIIVLGQTHSVLKVGF